MTNKSGVKEKKMKGQGGRIPFSSRVLQSHPGHRVDSKVG